MKITDKQFQTLTEDIKPFELSSEWDNSIKVANGTKDLEFKSSLGGDYGMAVFEILYDGYENYDITPETYHEPSQHTLIAKSTTIEIDKLWLFDGDEIDLTEEQRDKLQDILINNAELD